MIRNLFKVLFFPLFGRIKPQSKPADPPPLLSSRVHIFAGDFASERAATDYALALSQPSLAGDLGGAAIGPDDVEIIHGADRIAAARPMLHLTTPDPSYPANTLLMVSDRGYDTDRLTGGRVVHLGLCEVT